MPHCGAPSVSIKGTQRVSVGDDPAEIFTAIYETHYWEDDESRSGGGSNLYATEKIRKAIPGLILKVWGSLGT